MDMVEGLGVPLAELDSIRTEIKEDCVTRAHLSAEIEHYSEKLGKLRQGTGEKERAKTEEVRAVRGSRFMGVGWL